MIGLPWYAHKLHDYDERTEHLTMLQHGAYRLLMDAYYRRATPLPKPLEQLHRICKAIAPEEQAAISFILSEFFVLKDDGWHNKGCDKEINKAKDLSEKRRKAAKSSKKDAANVGAIVGTNAPANGAAIAPTIAHTAEPAKSEQMPLRNTYNDVDTSSLRSEVAPQKKNRHSKSDRGTRWPPDAVVSEDWIQAAGMRRAELMLPPIDLALEAERFANYWSAKAGPNSTKVDWRKTWMNWITDQSRSYTNGRPGHSKPTATDQHLAGIASLLDDIRGEPPGGPASTRGKT